MILLKWRIRGPIPGVISRREYQDMVRTALHAMGIHWHSHFLAKHFTFAGGMEYGYTKRTAEYEKRKARTKGHRQPLVWSGRSKERATSLREVRATFRKAEIVLHAPALNFRNRHSQVNMIEEIRAVSDAEVAELEREAVTAMDSRLNEITYEKGMFG